MNGGYGDRGGAEVDYQGGRFAGREARGREWWSIDRWDKDSRGKDTVASKPVRRRAPILHCYFNASFSVLPCIPAGLGH